MITCLLGAKTVTGGLSLNEAFDFDRMDVGYHKIMRDKRPTWMFFSISFCKIDASQKKIINYLPKNVAIYAFLFR